MAGEEEIRRLDALIDKATDESLDSTRRILTTASNTQQVGVETLITLNEQGEKLDNVEQRLDEINVDLNQTDKNLRELEKICGCCYCPCGNARSVKGSKQYKKAFGKKAKAKGKAPITSQPVADDGGPNEGGQNVQYIKKITGDDREEQMEENLQAVGNILENLHDIAVDMGDELGRQNAQLTRIDQKAGVDVAHIGQANRRIQNQL